MRAREFIVEQVDKLAKLDTAIAAPMKDTYILPGLPSQDPYKTYRFGVALARARGENADEGLPPFSAEGAFGEFAMVGGFDDSVGPLIDRALAMTNTPGGKRLAGTVHSEEPTEVNTASPVRGFKGYPR
jgi:hypothetical protein